MFKYNKYFILLFKKHAFLMMNSALMSQKRAAGNDCKNILITCL